MKAPVFQLYANCIPVKGARRSILCDLQSGVTKLIPNSLFSLLSDYSNQAVEEIKAAHEHQFDEEIDEYFAFLVEQGWGFMTEQPALFPPIELGYQVPELITHAIIDSDASSDHDFLQLIDQLEELGCKHFQFRFYDPIPLEKLKQIAAIGDGRQLRGMELMVPYGPDYANEDAVRQLCKDHPRIICLFITGAEKNRVLHASESVENMGVISYWKQAIDSQQCCGVIDKQYFVVSMSAFTEAKNFNSCLNRKMSVDTCGEIRNCPSMHNSFGNTANTTLREALFSDGFQAVWSVTKDHVNICKDCEYRYVCSDCRAFTQDDDPLGKPAGCNYDPFTATWGEQQQAPLAV